MNLFSTAVEAGGNKNRTKEESGNMKRLKREWLWMPGSCQSNEADWGGHVCYGTLKQIEVNNKYQ